MHVVPLVIWIVVVPVGVTVLLRLCIPPHSWTSMVGLSLLVYLCLCGFDNPRNTLW
jgi:hypothetical protein